METTKAKKVHTFLNHYKKGKNILFEDRPVRFSGIINYRIAYSDLRDFYTFINPEDIVDNFLSVAKYKIQAKCVFSIRNRNESTQRQLEFFDLICYVICYLRTQISLKCDDEELATDLPKNLFQKLSVVKDQLVLDLRFQNF